MDYAIINQFLDTNGDGTGTTNANGNYAVTPTEFYIQPGAGYYYKIARMIVEIEDTVGMSATDYGNITSGLTNGVSVQVKRGSTVLRDLTPDTVKANAQWAAYCYDADLKAWGSGNEVLAVRWTFEKSGLPAYLNGTENDRLSVTLNDDLTGLVTHTFLVQGTQSSTQEQIVGV